MIKDIESIFGAITPENIKNVPVIRDAMAIFIETLEELASESIDISRAFENESIREELFKTYLNDLYIVFKKAEENQKLLESIDAVNTRYGSTVLDGSKIPNVASVINNEHFTVFKQFKQKKGTPQAIEYIYDLIADIVQNKLQDIQFNIQERGIFDLRITGALPNPFYDYIIRPLSHPLGFVYSYDRMVQQFFEDNYSVIGNIYTVNELYVNCLLPDGTFEQDYYDDKTVVRFAENGQNIEITFDDGTVLKQTIDENDQITVVYLDGDGNIIKEYPTQCSIKKDIDVTTELSLKDDIEKVVEEKKSWDHFARLSPLNNQVGTTPESGISKFDIGTNPNLDNNGDYLAGTRQENYYAPDFSSNLKILLGQYIKDYQVIIGGEVSYVQPIKYTDVVDDNLKVLDWVPSVEAYERQNVENSDYIARELLFETQYINFFKNEILFEPVFNPTDDFIDYNGDSRGSYSTYLAYVDRDVVGDQRMVGGYWQEFDYDSDNLNGPVNYNYGVVYLETKVDAEVVNLQYHTFDFTKTVHSSFFEENYEDYKSVADELVVTFNSFDVDGGQQDYVKDYVYYYDDFENRIFSDIYTTTIELYKQDKDVSDDSLMLFNSFSIDGAVGDYDEYQVQNESLEEKITTIFFNVNVTKNETHTEYDTSVPWFEHIGFGTGSYDIGSGSLKYTTKEVNTGFAESYTELGKFDQKSDDDFTFGVYRNGVLLEDNNISALP